MSATKLQRRQRTYTPFGSTLAKETDELRTRVRRLFEEPFGKWFAESITPDLFTQPVGWYPAVDVAETPEEFTITAELPGMTRKDIDVGYEDGVLTIRGEKEEEKQEEHGNGRRYHLYERSYGTFQRSFAIPAADPEQIKAEFADGVLTVHLPKLPEPKIHGRKIEISERS